MEEENVFLSYNTFAAVVVQFQLLIPKTCVSIQLFCQIQGKSSYTPALANDFQGTSEISQAKIILFADCYMTNMIDLQRNSSLGLVITVV